MTENRNETRRNLKGWVALRELAVAGNRLFVRAPFRSVRMLSVIVLLTMASWLVAANHCAISSWMPAAAEAEQESHCHSTESEDLPVPGMQMLCGDELNSPVPPVAVAPATQLHFLKPAWVEIASILFEEPVAQTRSFPGHAPPGGASFVDLFLTRRLLAHAPPVGFA